MGARTAVGIVVQQPPLAGLRSLSAHRLGLVGCPGHLQALQHSCKCSGQLITAPAYMRRACIHPECNSHVIHSSYGVWHIHDRFVPAILTLVDTSHVIQAVWQTCSLAGGEG